MDTEPTYIAFDGWQRLASGSVATVLQKCKARLDADQTTARLLIFEEQTGKQRDFDFRGSLGEVLERVVPKPVRIGPGRPRLGVISREVSLLPRHWEWLEAQPNGASAALRRLVGDARKRKPGESNVRAVIDATCRFMTVIGGNLPGFEEACRALYARDVSRLKDVIGDWPKDVRGYVLGRMECLEHERAS